MLSYDNRETCTTLTPSSCIPYTGIVSDNIKDTLPCRPNINDVLKSIQQLVDGIKTSLGDNTTLDKKCLTSLTTNSTQKDINQAIITQLCDLKTALQSLQSLTGEDIELTIDISCLENEGCTPKTKYTVQELFEKLITGYCNLLERVTEIENVLNL